MYTYQTLTTEKYWLESAQEEAVQIRHFQRQQARETFTTFIGGLFSMSFAFVAVLTSHQWLPATMDLLAK